MATDGLCECGCGQRTSLSPYTDRPRGYLKGKPLRFVRGHNNRGREIRGPRYVVGDCGYDTPCWIWQLALQPNGYAVASLPGGQPRAGHLIFWERENGPVPAGAHIDHLCRNKACVNPDHLEAVTCAENARRGANAKLTYEDIEEIKKLRADGLLQREVAERFGVCRQTVSDIERGLTWAAPGGICG